MINIHLHICLLEIKKKTWNIKLTKKQIFITFSMHRKSLKKINSQKYKIISEPLNISIASSEALFNLIDHCANKKQRLNRRDTFMILATETWIRHCGRWGRNRLWVRFLAVSDIYPRFIEHSITWVPSGFSGYIWLDTKNVLKRKEKN